MIETQVAIFEARNRRPLEASINNWLLENNANIKIVDIKYQHAASIQNEDVLSVYSAMIIYEVTETEKE